jgi:DNA helicase-2/ATP-dependent DNA helicase PcrA
MDASHPLLEKLNDAQRAAVAAPEGPTLVLAGAGSGKTRVLTHRVGWLIQECGVSAHGILAVTFTNKAAAEMRGRIEALLGIPGNALWIGTFHGIAHRLLRLHWREAGLPQGFQILDDEDQHRLVRKLVREQNLDETRWVPREIQHFINNNKDEGRRPKHLEDRGDPTRRELIKQYDLYQKRCNALGVVDFAELLLRTFEVLRDQPALFEHYRRRFRHVLVDEFQDTNGVQYDWLKLLAGGNGMPFAVGDDDQSIYRWRGARVENMLHFQRDWPNARLFRLEQNYRSTGTILEAANAVIARNTDRLGKKLWTSGGRGAPIRVYAAFNDRDEADFVVNRIRDHVLRGGRRSDCAILYRSNAQSRAFEETLLASRMPYRVYGGLRFFERAEIKDALAYLRLTQNRSDDISFERVVNLPTRGIGQASLDRVRELARARGLPLAVAATEAMPALGPKASSALLGFLQLLDRLEHDIGGQELGEQVRIVIEASGLREHHAKQKDDKGEARVENLDELVNAAGQYQVEPDSEMPPLAGFLAHAALESGETQAAEWEDCVQLMTLHSAKGLEFPLVFLVGLEEGLFPSERSAFDLEKLPEERRLCYVGVTRAMRELYLSHAESRRIYGKTENRMPSRFLDEIPPELLEEVRPRLQVSRPVHVPGRRDDYRQSAPAASPPPRRPVADESTPMRLGTRVRHPKFGDGVVVRFEGSGANVQVQVNFERAGAKWLMFAYANLQPV